MNAEVAALLGTVLVSPTTDADGSTAVSVIVTRGPLAVGELDPQQVAVLTVQHDWFIDVWR
ncbi:MAG: hypothetical protein LC808_40450 [Actinobacteria bacterium]|nr:hypothetical protein [Actinomycetota bacterium]